MPYNVNGNYIMERPISIADVQSAVPVTIKRTVSGTTESRSSSDVGVLCGGAVGDTVPDNAGGTAWTVAARVPINFWSARKPIYNTKIGILDTADFSGLSRTLSGYKVGGGIKKRALTGSQFISSLGDGQNREPGDPGDAVWEHDRPIADGLCAFRLTDFEGYWHRASNMFHIGAIVGQVDYIPVPSDQSTPGQDVYFEIYFRPVNGTIIPAELFGDCYTGTGASKVYYYPGVILACSSGFGLHYVKTADEPVNLSNSWTYASLKVNTKTFLDYMMSDYFATHTRPSNPYSVAPFISGTKWTATVVLLSKAFTGGEGLNHKLSSDTIVVRLQYQSGSEVSSRDYVDRRTLPLRQEKYTKFEWMKITLNLYKISTTSKVYKITDFYLSAKKLTTDNVTLKINAILSAYLGTVNVPNVGSGSSVTVDNFNGNAVTFTGTGVVGTYVSLMDHSYTITGVYAGNEQCNATFYVKEGTDILFQGGFSRDVYQGNGYYQEEIQLF